MARRSITVTLGPGSQDNAGGIALYNPTPSDSGSAPDAVAVASDVATCVADAVTVAANVATLVADGASPTQAHVTTLNTHWGTLNTAITAANTAATGAPAGDLIISYDTSVITTKNQLAAAITAALRVVANSAILT